MSSEIERWRAIVVAAKMSFQGPGRRFLTNGLLVQTAFFEQSQSFDVRSMTPRNQADAGSVAM